MAVSGAVAFRKVPFDDHRNAGEYCFGLPPAVSPLYSTFIAKYGQSGMAFLICMGPEWTNTCADTTNHCMYTHESQVQCLSVVKCMGNGGAACAHYLAESQ